MATRMQQRRGTAAQWISTNSGNGPVLNAGEIGYETDTNKFKIGDGTNHWINLDYFIDANSTVNPSFGTSIVFEGATADSFETTILATDPTADRTITLPDATGTVVLADGSGNVTVSGNLTVSGTTTTINSTTINATTGIVFEGATADAHETTLTVTDPTADRTITFPDASGTVALTSDIAELSQDAIDAALTAGTGITKTYSDGANTLTIAVDTTAIQARVTDVSDTEIGYLNGVTSAIQTQLDDKSTAAKAETLTNKSISLGSNTVTSTLAQLNTAVSDADVASLAGTETLTNKSISLTTNTVTGTKAEFNSAMSDADFATIAGTETLTNKTLTSPTVSGLALSDASIVIEGATANAYKTTLTVIDPTDNRTITFPDSSGTVALAGDVATSLGSYIELTDIGAQSGVAGLNGSKNLLVPGASIIIEGATGTEYTTATTLTVVDPTAARTITFPDATGTVQLRVTDVDDTEIGYLNGVTSSIQTQLDAKAAAASYAALAGATFTGAVSGTSLTLSGDLTVNGTTTNINSTNLVVEDKNVVLGDTATPTDTTADGGGITLKGATDKTFNWVDATDAWTSSEHINLASGKTLKYNGTDLVAAQTGNSGKYLTTDGTSTSWGTVEGYSAPTIGSTSIASGATVTTVAGLTLTAPTFTGTVTLPQGKLTGGSTTVSANTATTVSTVALADFTTMEYTVSIKQGSKIRSSKVLVQTDGTAVDSVEHSILETGGAMTGVNVTAAVSSTNCILTVTITNASTTNAAVKVVNTII